MSYTRQYRNSRGNIALDPNGLQFKINARANDARRINQDSARGLSDLFETADRDTLRAAIAARVEMCESTVCQTITQHPSH